ncbi:FG-GAP-like repeat-containing protein [Streptomyces sp. NPDC047974]|uniref:FG-GAP-like repeat-containing protein n=1 Tax=Streptomyces sp. NPDC047974 TaxID=3154343 RepID=UPI0033C4B185
MSSTSRRALRLASALVAAGLALTCAPGVSAADDSNGLLTLTEEQAQSLEQRLQPDPYGDQATARVTPDEGPSTGSGTDGSTDSGTADASTSDASTAAAGLTANVKTALEGSQGHADTVTLAGAGSDYLAIGSLGMIQRLAKDGKEVWTRDNASFTKEWGIMPYRLWEKEFYPVRVVMGYNAVSPFFPTSDLGYDTGDLTGDGVDDLAVTMNVASTEWFTIPGSTLRTGTFVSVLDGATGKTLWWKLTAGAYQVRIVGRTLVYGDTPYWNPTDTSGLTTALYGLRFTYADGRLTPAANWTFDTGKRAQTTFGGMQELPGGLLAVSWNERKTSATAPTKGHTLVVDPADGGVQWQAENALLSRALKYDATRGRLVAVEMADLTDGMRYEIAAYDAATGARTKLDSRINALPTNLAVGRLSGDDKAEYAVAESTLDPNLFVNAATARVVDGTTGAEKWSYSIKRDPGNGRDGSSFWGLRIADGKLVASAQNDRDKDTPVNEGGQRLARLIVLAGNNGSVKWKQEDAHASPLFAETYQDKDGWHVRTSDPDQNIRTFGLAGGHEQNVLARRGALSVATSADVDRDGAKDLIVGGDSQGLWAYDGPSLVAGSPKLLWKATLPGRTADLELGDTTGDGRPEIVVAADKAAVVLDAATGRTLTEIDGRGQYVYTVTPADLDGDGRSEVVVPTDKVRAHRGGGALMWEYAAPDADVAFSTASVAKGRVYAAYNTRGAGAIAIAGGKPAVNGVALDARNGTLAWKADPVAPEGTLYAAGLRNGTFASPQIPYADGNAVVFTWGSRTAAGGWPAVTEIRDGRTGEVLRSRMIGGINGCCSFFTSPAGLTQVAPSGYNTWGPGSETGLGTLPMTSGGYFTGPGGRPLLWAGVQGGARVYDGSLLGTDASFPSSLTGLNLKGAQNVFTGDLDGDGVAELVSLNFDDVGFDRISGLQGTLYYLPLKGIRQLTVATLTTS